MLDFICLSSYQVPSKFGRPAKTSKSSNSFFSFLFSRCTVYQSLAEHTKPFSADCHYNGWLKLIYIKCKCYKHTSTLTLNSRNCIQNTNVECVYTPSISLSQTRGIWTLCNHDLLLSWKPPLLCSCCRTADDGSKNKSVHTHSHTHQLHIEKHTFGGQGVFTWYAPAYTAPWH